MSQQNKNKEEEEEEIIEESKESRMIKETFVARHIGVATYPPPYSNKAKHLYCSICDEIILELEKYKASSRAEFVDIMFNHLILKHEKEIHYGKVKKERRRR